MGARPTLASLSDAVDDMKHRLFGNGQQGLIKDLELAHEKAVREMTRKHEESSAAITALEKKSLAGIAAAEKKAEAVGDRLDRLKWLIIGAMGAIQFLMGSGSLSAEKLVHLWWK